MLLCLNHDVKLMFDHECDTAGPTIFVRDDIVVVCSGCGKRQM